MAATQWEIRKAEKDASRWRTWLNIRLSGPASILRTIAFRRIVHQVDDGSGPAALLLAHFLVETNDAPLRDLAAQRLSAALKQPCVDAVWQAWLDTSSPALLEILRQQNRPAREGAERRILSRLALSLKEECRSASPEEMPHLINAQGHPGVEISANARAALRALKSQKSIDWLCLNWTRSRADDLAALIREGGYHAENPADVRVITALYFEKAAGCLRETAEEIPALIAALSDVDPLIRSQAQARLMALQNPPAREALFQAILQQENAPLRDLMIQLPYLPEKAEDRVLYLFLTAQFDRALELDFDLRILQSVYVTAPQELRSRIARTVQRSGRPEFLPVLSLRDLGASDRPRTQADNQIYIQSLTDNKKWSDLWKVLFEVHISQGRLILNILQQNNWRPDDDEGIICYEKLLTLYANNLLEENDPRWKDISCGVPVVRLILHNHVNDISFAPHKPWVALACGEKKVVIWDYSSGQIHRKFNSFAHSIGEIDFSPGGTLLIGERTNATNVECLLYRWDGGEGIPNVMGRHRGSITLLETFSDDFAVTAGRDQRISYWNLGKNMPVTSHSLDFWPRTGAASRSDSTAVLIHERPLLVHLPELATTAVQYPASNRGSSGVRASSGSCADLLPGQDILLGCYNGQVIWNKLKDPPNRYSRILLHRHKGKATDVRYLTRADVFVSCGSDGEIIFINRGDLSQRGKLTVRPNAITAGRFSQDEKFMATASSDDCVTLWNLETMKLEAILRKQLVEMTPQELKTVHALMNNPVLTLEMRQTLQYLHCLLQYRFRYEIQVSDQPVMTAGEFDILLDEGISG